MDHSDKGLELKMTSFEYLYSGTFTSSTQLIKLLEGISYTVGGFQYMFFNKSKIPLTEAHKNKTFVLTLQLKILDKF